MKILITGGAGYIGSHTVLELVKQGREVVVFDNLERGHRQAIEIINNLDNLDKTLAPVKLFIGDLRNRQEIEKCLTENPVDACMHFAAYALAGESMQKPEVYFENNVHGSLNLFRALVIAGVKKIVFSSTCALYGAPKTLPVRENSPESPESPYGESKLMVERMLGWFYKTHGLNSVCLRYFNACGAEPPLGEDHKPETHLIPMAIEAALGRREKFILNGNDYPTPDGTCVRDYIHVLDLANAHLLALKKLNGGFEGFDFYNCGVGRGYSNLEIINQIKKVSGRDFPLEIGPRREGDPAAIYADNSKIKRGLGWSPKYNLDDIISSAWDWHSNHPDGYEK